MPTARNGDVDLFYETHASETGRETVVFCSELGLGAWLWGWQQPALAGPYETLVWDYRGTGRSDAPDGPYAVATLAADLEAVLGDAGVDRAHLVGCGLGGMVALAYARRYRRARSLTLVNTASTGDAVDSAALDRLFADDWANVAFSPAFRETVDLDEVESWRSEDDANPGTREAQREAMETFDAGPLFELGDPALVLAAVGDPVVPFEEGRRLAEDLPRGEFEAMEGRHLAFVEHSVAVTDRIEAFLETVE